MKKEQKELKTYFGLFNSRDLYDDDVVADIRASLAECWECEESEVSDEDVSEDLWRCLDDEKMNLDKELDSKYIVGFADLGLWDGHHIAGKKVGTNINKIFDFSDYYDYEWYADLYDVRCNLYHHDGTNHVLFRCAKSEEAADIMISMARRGELTEEYFFRNTVSLRPYIAKIYGWKNYHHSKKRDSQPAK
jgi:hypothetical protein